MKRALLCAALVVGAASLTLAAPLAAQEKLTSEDIVTRHLESLGSPQAIAAVKTRTADGEGTLYDTRRPRVVLSGPAAFLLDGNKMAVHIGFGDPQYPEEVFAFDGKKPQIKRVRPEGPSELGEFFRAYGQLLREGLVGGALNTNWPLLPKAQSKGELKSTGLKTVEGRQLHEVKYSIRNGARDFQVRLYFDPASFRHVRTVYHLTIHHGMRSQPNLRVGSVRDSENVLRYTLEEDFSEFDTIDQISLPKRWQIRLINDRALNSPGANLRDWQWDLRFRVIVHNQSVDQKLFVIGQGSHSRLIPVGGGL